MRWDGSDGNTGRIPAECTKNKREQTVPLTAVSLAVIEAQPNQERKKGKKRKSCPYVFSTNAMAPISGYSKAKRRLDGAILKARLEIAKKQGDDLAKVQPLPHWTYHDLRCTAVTGMARLGIHPHVADAVLNHKEGVIRGVAAVYQRHRYEDEARLALEAWKPMSSRSRRAKHRPRTWFRWQNGARNFAVGAARFGRRTPGTLHPARRAAFFRRERR